MPSDSHHQEDLLNTNLFQFHAGDFCVPGSPYVFLDAADENNQHFWNGLHPWGDGLFPPIASIQSTSTSNPLDENRPPSRRYRGQPSVPSSISTTDSSGTGEQWSQLVPEGSDVASQSLWQPPVMKSAHCPTSLPFDEGYRSIEGSDHSLLSEPRGSGHNLQTPNDPNGVSKPRFYCDVAGCRAARGRSFTRSADLERHVKEQHAVDSPRFICGNCQFRDVDKRYVRKDRLKSHMRTFHEMQDDMLYQCLNSFCANEGSAQELYFASYRDLDRHRIRAHGGGQNVDYKWSMHDGPTAAGATANNEMPGGLHPPMSLPPSTKHAMSPASPRKLKGNKRQRTSPGLLPAKKALSNHFVVARKNFPTRAADPPTQTPTMGMRLAELVGDKENLQNEIGPAGSVCVATDSIIEMLSLMQYRDVVVALRDLKKSEVIVNFPKKIIKLSGPKDINQDVKDRLEKSLKEVRLLRFGDIGPKRTSTCRRSGRRSAQNFTNRSPPSGTKTLPIRSKEDSEKLATWVKLILPSLPKILDDLVGKDYSAVLVRQETQAGDAAVIRIQSASGQSENVRKRIRDHIGAICKQNGRQNILLEFSQGHVMNLVGDQNEVIRDAEANDLDQFPHHRRYWKNLGLSASGGLLNCEEVSTTIGGNIIVDGQQCLLTVDHFIDSSLRSGFISENLQLTSPSLLDKQELTEDIDQIIRDIETLIEDEYPEDTTTDVLRDIDSFKDLGNLIRQFNGFKMELARLPTDLVAGRLDKRSGQETVEFAYSLQLDQPERELVFMQHRMDWSTFTVCPFRFGINRHRHRFCHETRTVDFQSEETYPTGAGDACRESCAIVQNMPVYYVGQASGRLNGEINAAPVLRSTDGKVTWEWAIVAETDRQLDGEDYRGDSGAWVLRSSDSAVVGLLCSWANGVLLLTPIESIFSQITQQSRTRDDVRLPPLPSSPGPNQLYTEAVGDEHAMPICRVKNDKPRKPKRYSLPTIYPTNDRHEDNNRGKLTMSIDALVRQEESKAASDGCSDVEDRANSPRSPPSTPPLSTSVISSPKAVFDELRTPPLWPQTDDCPGNLPVYSLPLDTSQAAPSKGPIPGSIFDNISFEDLRIAEQTLDQSNNVSAVPIQRFSACESTPVVRCGLATYVNSTC